MMISGSSYDYDKLLQEAQIRWLKPSEVYFILINHERYPIEPETPQKPPSGSLFLFNRRVHRFFRKDGHMWRKKKKGITVGEAHERLKVGNIAALNCYYAHGELNPYFQRRSYWMLDRSCDDIVLVHYREVSEGRFLPPLSQQPKEHLPSLSGSSNVNKSQFQGLPSGFGEVHDSYQCSGSSLSGEVNSKYVRNKLDTDCLNMINISENSDLSLQSVVDHALLKLEEQLSLDKCDNKFEDLLPANTNEYEKHETLAFLDNENGSSFHVFQESLIPERECSVNDQGVHGNRNSQSLGFHCRISRNISPWNDMLDLSSSSTVINADVKASDLMAVSSVREPSFHSCNATITDQCGGNELEHESNFQQFSSEEEGLLGIPFDWLEQCNLQLSTNSEKNEEHMSGAINAGYNSEVVTTRNESNIELMGSLDLRLEGNAYSSDFLGMWSDQGQHETSLATEPSLTVAQKQLFRINEISPEWSFSFEKTKVLIVGDFLCIPSSYAWAVMFGDVEVPAEIVQQGVLRCETPEHTSGRVPLCITSRNRQSCSVVREFEFHTNPATNSMETLHHVNSEELLLLVKLVRVLLCQHHESSVSKGASQTAAESHRKFKAAEEKWLQIIDQLQVGCEISSGTVDWVLLELIKDKFQQWQLSKLSSKDGNVPLSKEEQGIIHMISGLGYEWALNMLLDVGVGVNFRDFKGWTALHWAARFGRERMAAALLAAGALAGAVTDPTPHDPLGKTAGAIAAASGHKGLAGYLSEADLTSHLSSLTFEECEISEGSSAVEAERVVESISERTPQLHGNGTEDDLSLKDTLAAVKNAAQAAARIQAAFRAHSFRKRRELADREFDEYGMNSKDLHGLIKNTRAALGYHDHKFDKAALSIQKQYRGWKDRKDFLTLRRHVVKIQAHVRGHQTRKKYRELLWTVGVLDKVVLRWRRRGVGLRGFRSETILVDEDEGEEEDIVKVFRKQKVDAALDQAYSRVRSMVESPRARRQYRRMLESYLEFKLANQGGVEEGILRLQDNFELMQDDEFLRWFSSCE